MTITATLIGYYKVCHRKLWLHANDIRMEHTSDIVYEGKLIGETTYPDRAEKNTQVALSVPLATAQDGKEWTGAAKIDYYDAKTRTVHETKKSAKMEQAHIAQVQFYLYLLAKSGIEGAKGIIEYPKQRERTQVTLTPADEQAIQQDIVGIQRLLSSSTCPGVINKPVCKQCAYYEYCYADEI